MRNSSPVARRLREIAKAEMGLFQPEPVLEIHAEGSLDELLSPQLAEFCGPAGTFRQRQIPPPVFLTRRAQVLNWGYVGAQGPAPQVARVRRRPQRGCLVPGITRPAGAGTTPWIW